MQKASGCSFMICFAILLLHPLMLLALSYVLLISQKRHWNGGKRPQQLKVMLQLNILHTSWTCSSVSTKCKTRMTWNYYSCQVKRRKINVILPPTTTTSSLQCNTTIVSLRPVCHCIISCLFSKYHNQLNCGYLVLCYCSQHTHPSQ